MGNRILSLKQYQVLKKVLDDINKDVTTIRQKALPEAGYIDNNDLLILLQVTPRTLYRWRQSGRLPYKKLGCRFYYKADLILKNFKMQPDEKNEEVEDVHETKQLPPDIPLPDENQLHIPCEQCPLFVILNSED
jgi:hypothetical protein